MSRILVLTDSIRPFERPCSIAARIEAWFFTIRRCRSTNARIRQRRAQPIQTSRAKDVKSWVLAYSFSSRLPDPHHLAVLTRPGVVGAAPTHSGISRIRLPPASPSLLRQVRRRRSLTSARIVSASWRTRTQIQPDHVEDLVDEQRIVGQLERVGSVWLQLERL